jgi:hypothetical protein
MDDIKLMVPTYDPDGPLEWDYEHQSKLTLHEVEGLRIVMGERTDQSAPDVQIGRACVRAAGKPPVQLWRIFVYPDGADPLCMIEIRAGDSARIEDASGKLIHERQL